VDAYDEGGAASLRVLRPYAVSRTGIGHERLHDPLVDGRQGTLRER
jgi:hypothetical protein